MLDKFYEDCAVAIGDTEADKELAAKIGSKFIAVENGLRNKKYLHADYYAKDFCDVCMFWDDFKGDIYATFHRQ